MTAVLMLLARSLLDWELALGRLVLWRCTPAAATQVVGAGFLAIGLFSRPAAAAMTASDMAAVLAAAAATQSFI